MAYNLSALPAFTLIQATLALTMQKVSIDGLNGKVLIPPGEESCEDSRCGHGGIERPFVAASEQ